MSDWDSWWDNTPLENAQLLLERAQPGPWTLTRLGDGEFEVWARAMGGRGTLPDAGSLLGIWVPHGEGRPVTLPATQLMLHAILDLDWCVQVLTREEGGRLHLADDHRRLAQIGARLQACTPASWGCGDSDIGFSIDNTTGERIADWRPDGPYAPGAECDMFADPHVRLVTLAPDLLTHLTRDILAATGAHRRTPHARRDVRAALSGSGAPRSVQGRAA